MRVWLVAGLLVTGVGGCHRGAGTETDVVDDVVDARFSLLPEVAGQGTTVDVHVGATASDFEFGETELDLGAGITVESVTVQDGYNAVAHVIVDGNAELGTRDATISIGGPHPQTEVLTGGFEVISESFQIDPANAKMGETVQIAIVGTDTHWEEGRTWIGLGEDFKILDFSVLSETLATATVSVYPDARPGPRDVMMEDGSHVVTLYDGFLVDRAVITATFDPPQAYQGESVEFDLDGLETNFAEGMSLEFWDNGGKNADIEVTQLTVLDSDRAVGTIHLSNAARVGFRDVFLTYGGESIFIPQALEVLDGAPDLSDVAVGLGFDVERSIDNATGELFESVTAYAYFVIPLDPSCGSSPPMADGPAPYDQNGVFASPPEPEPVDCPNPETVSAGDFVWFEGPENTVTLEKYIIESTGQIIYWGFDLTLDDYHFDTMYDLHTQGDPDGIPEVTVPEVQPTVPGDFYLLSPELWNDFTWNRGEDFTYTWTPAMTYPEAYFGTEIRGTLVADADGDGVTDDPGFAGCFPWDDGVHTYLGGELSQLQAGPVGFTAYSYIAGPNFGLPFSTIQTNQSDSVLSTSAQLILE